MMILHVHFQVNRIPELFDLIKKPDVLCTASRILEQNNGKYNSDRTSCMLYTEYLSFQNL